MVIHHNHHQEFKHSYFCFYYYFFYLHQDSLELTPVAARAGKLLARRLYDNGTEHMDYENVGGVWVGVCGSGCVWEWVGVGEE